MHKELNDLTGYDNDDYRVQNLATPVPVDNRPIEEIRDMPGNQSALRSSNIIKVAEGENAKSETPTGTIQKHVARITQKSHFDLTSTVQTFNRLINYPANRAVDDHSDNQNTTQ